MDGQSAAVSVQLCMSEMWPSVSGRPQRFEQNTAMPNESFLLFRIIAAAVFFGALYAGFYMLRNIQKLFGSDPNIPSENESARAYSTLQVFVIWGHILIASGAFALLLH